MTRSFRILAVAATATLLPGPAVAEPKAKNNAGAPAAQGGSVRVISPIFGQLVMFSLPRRFKTAFENTKDNGYIREAVPESESVERWSQMITVTGTKGAASNPQARPQSFAAGIAGGFKRACPDTFAAKPIGAIKIGVHDAFVALASCGTVTSRAGEHSETALLIAIRGTADIYTIQWAERAAASSQPLAVDPERWKTRVDQLGPIRLCPLVPGEAAPYPSCIKAP